MKLNIIYKREKEWFVEHIREYPDYESQGKIIDELKGNLIEICGTISAIGSGSLKRKQLIKTIGLCPPARVR